MDGPAVGRWVRSAFQSFGGAAAAACAAVVSVCRVVASQPTAALSLWIPKVPECCRTEVLLVAKRYACVWAGQRREDRGKKGLGPCNCDVGTAKDVRAAQFG